ncbi:FAD-binding protein [Nostoc sp.]|uniref:FAD-binding protein n=1 Tax=Nostoc sp. TaxID=1180 RepID=UPI002FF9DC8E
MSVNQLTSEQSLTSDSHLDLETDVLVIGGGPAGAWAAYNAVASGARVILVDKGYCGSSGATASGGTSVWYVANPDQREMAMASREALGGFLSERDWMERVLDRTHANLHQLGGWGYPFPSNQQGQPYYPSLQQGAEYMRLMRKQVKKAGVQILDHSPALELLVDQTGAVAGAKGIRRQAGGRWTVRAAAVVIATGGCAFLSKALGCNVLTGDGYLMAAEAGAEMSGMEFSNSYALTPAFASVTKGAFYRWATFTYEDGTVIEGAGSQRGRSIIAKTLLTQPVYSSLHETPEEIRAWMRTIQHNFFLPFDRKGIDPFTQRFPVTLRLEGTVRGTGGIRIIDNSCATSVLGLYAAGDAATRELICGGFTGGGSYNAAWAMSSGYWSGQAAANYTRQLGAKANQRQVHSVGQAAVSSDSNHTFNPQEVIQATQAEVLPYDRNLFRTEQGLSDSLGRLHSLWREVRHSTAPSDSQVLPAREAAAMVATARWMYTSAQARKETRGMHKHQDYPQQDANQQYRLISGGLDTVWAKPEQEIVNKELVTL